MTEKESLEKLTEEEFDDALFSVLKELEEIVSQYSKSYNDLLALKDEIEYYKSKGYRIEYFLKDKQYLTYKKYKRKIGFQG